MHGGLGNQLFQYATGRALSLRKKTRLMLDITDYSKKTHRKYGLDNFQIKARAYSKKKLSNIYRHYPNFIEKLVLALTGRKVYSDFIDSKVYLEKKLFDYDDMLLHLTNDAYISGYWQNEKYFRNIRKTLLKEITIKNNLINKNLLSILKIIKSTNSTSIHIRRTDYLENKKYFITSKRNYYQRAIMYINKKMNDTNFFVFTDDPDWVKNNFINSKNMILISGKGFTDAQELYLMKNCKNNIITNSSYSWWGAWLNKNPEKIVISPKHWFNSVDFDSDGIILKEWVKI